jgi:AraC-like DNA-binding protein
MAGYNLAMIVSLQPMPEGAGADDAPPDLTHMPTHLLLGRNRRYHWQGVGALSIKTFRNDRALYDVGDGHFAVDEASYLLLNHAQPYAITIETEELVESFCLFFGLGFAEDVFYSHSRSWATLLDEPDGSLSPLQFVDRTYRRDELLSLRMERLRSAILREDYERTWLEEQVHAIAGCLLLAQQRVRREIAAFPAARPATREELYRRLHRAHDYALASLHRPVTIAELAQAACLSPNHFLRTFRQLFHQSPHQFLTAHRLARAQRLLRHTELSVTAICCQVGFESLGSFSALFRRHVDLSPEAWRRQNGDFQEAR